MPDLGIAFHKPFAEQVAALRLRLGNLVPTETWTDMRHAEHDRGWMVAGAQKADLLADLGAAVDKADVQGTTLEEFRRDFRQIVARNGWTGWTGEGSAKGEAWRTKVIYQTNMRVSHAAGRFAQLTAGGFAFWVYRHSGAEHPRLHHLALNGVALPPDHPFWKTHYPPNGFGCGCTVHGAHTEAGIRRQGGDPDKELPGGWDERDLTGQLPAVGKGWDYAPGASVVDTLNALTGKLPALPAPIGAAMFHGWPQRGRQALSDEFAAFVDRSLSDYVRKDFMIVGALKPRWVVAAQNAGVEIESAEIAVTDVDVQHSFRGTEHVTAPSTRKVNREPKVDPLDLDWYKGMVDLLLTPQAVLLDRRESDLSLLLIYPGQSDDDLAKLVLQLNIPVKKAGGVLNTVRTGRYISLANLRGENDAGLINLIEGSLEQEPGRN